MINILPTCSTGNHSRIHIGILLMFCALAACGTAPSEMGQKPRPYDGSVGGVGRISGVANEVPFSDSVHVRYFPEIERVDVRAALPPVSGVSCGSLKVTFYLDLEPGIQDLRRNGVGHNFRGVLVADADGDAVCDFLEPTPDEDNSILLEAGDHQGELAGTFEFVAVGARKDIGLDTLRVAEGRLTFTVEFDK